MFIVEPLLSEEITVVYYGLEGTERRFFIFCLYFDLYLTFGRIS
jgi:hypothetical protein